MTDKRNAEFPSGWQHGAVRAADRGLPATYALVGAVSLT